MSEAHLQPCETSMMTFFAKIVNNYQPSKKILGSSALNRKKLRVNWCILKLTCLLIKAQDK